MKNTTMLKVVTPLLALGLTVTACSDSGSADSGASAEHNDQDVAFATDMIPHHAGAVEMAELAVDRAESQEVKELASDIEAAQGPEIEQMSSWLETWGEDVPEGSGGMGGMDHGDMGDDMAGMDDMPGMMSAEEMSELEATSGADFDQLFLSMMVEHHKGAIEMAQVEQSEGENPAAIDLAETIEESQTEEIQTMEDLLADAP